FPGERARPAGARHPCGLVPLARADGRLPERWFRRRSHAAKAGPAVRRADWPYAVPEDARPLPRQPPAVPPAASLTHRFPVPRLGTSERPHRNRRSPAVTYRVRLAATRLPVPAFPVCQGVRQAFSTDAAAPHAPAAIRADVPVHERAPRLFPAPSRRC